MNVFIVPLEHAILYPECINTKKKHSEWYEMGVKSFVLCCNENEPETPLMFCTRFNKVKGFCLLSVSRCGISRRQAHVRVIGECFPFDIIGQTPGWPR